MVSWVKRRGAVKDGSLPFPAYRKRRLGEDMEPIGVYSVRDADASSAFTGRSLHHLSEGSPTAFARSLYFRGKWSFLNHKVTELFLDPSAHRAHDDKVITMEIGPSDNATRELYACKSFTRPDSRETNDQLPECFRAVVGP